jgi:putative heme-binding domain-containing protein
MTFVLGAQNKTKNLYEILTAYGLIPYCDCEIEESFLGGLGDGLRQAGKNFRTAFPNLDSMGARRVDAILTEAKDRAQTQSEPFERWRVGVRLLAYENFEKAKNVLEKSLEARRPEIQLAALHALAGFKNPEVATILLKPWRSFTPSMREEVLAAIFSRAERLGPLLDAIDAGTISAGQISQARRTALLSQKNSALREHAAKLFGGENAFGSRKDALKKYQAALSLKGDKVRGRKVFENNCMVCHRAGGIGNDVGPNLETVRQWDAEKIMTNILDPNREVAPNYVSYEIELKDGSSQSGIIASETAGSISLKRADNGQETVLRQNIARISSSGMSLMPEGLEAAIAPQDMADLIAFLLNR